jgi:putative protease
MISFAARYITLNLVNYLEILMASHNSNLVIPKILAPIRAYTGAVKVIQAGADEIYCGVRTPGLEEFELYRGASTDISTYDEFRRVVEHAHRNSVKVLLTVNQPFIIDSMEKTMAKHIQTCVDAGVDSLIVGDLGMLQLIKSIAKDVELCASTYLSAMNRESVEFLQRAGFSRVVLERHVPFKQISDIAKNSSIEVEVFLHGSGCSNINVNCYFYHYKFPEMEQGYLTIDGIKFPCSLPYEVYDGEEAKVKLGTFPLIDAYTFCALCRLPALVRSGVYGLKIEGRGINEEYQASTTKLYRESLDLLQKGDEERFLHRLEEIKKNFIPLAQTLPLNNLQELCCEQERCYYAPTFHAPYKTPLSWGTWTKLQCKLLVVQP